MKNFKIKWRIEAYADLETIIEYISETSLTYAENLTSKIEFKIKRLKIDPFIGQVEESLKIINHEYRYLIEGHYKIIYRFDQDLIFIIAVFDTRRNPQSLKSEIDETITGDL